MTKTIMLLLFTLVTLHANIVNVNSAEAFEDAVESASPGDTVILASGTYDVGTSITMYNGGTEQAPILVMAESVGSVELTGDTYFDLRQVAYVTIKGFVFTSTDKTVIKSQASHHIRITRNVFRLEETSSRKWVIIQGIWDDPYAPSHHNRIDHNLFEEKHFPGNFITIDGQADPVYQSSQYDRIDHNHFRDIGPRAENEMEAIRVGWSEMSMSSGFTVIEYNLFENCDGDPEIVSIKTCDDTVRYHTFRSSQGTLCLRHGNRSTVDGNFFFGEGKEGAGGIRLYGDDHHVLNNYFQGLTGERWDAALTLTNGDYDGGSSYSRHFRINRALLYNNTLVDNAHNIEIGFTNNGHYDRPPRDVVMMNNLIQGNANLLVQVFSQPIDMTWMTNLANPIGNAQLGVEPVTGEIDLIDPLLIPDGELQRLAAGSPAIDGGTADPLITEDMDGQLRLSPPDVGADEYSEAAILRHPLTSVDVGPDAEEAVGIISRSISHPVQIGLGVYPNPVNGELTIQIDDVQPGIARLDLYDLRGRYLRELWNGETEKHGHLRIRASAQELASGTYLLVFRDAGGIQTSRVQILK